MNTVEQSETNKVIDLPHKNVEILPSKGVLMFYISWLGYHRLTDQEIFY